ncbi:MAG: glycosyltransferase [Actinobacteria bacterium]|nr:glycosyltransferase [Actinomycetota bacterium]
MPVVFVLPVMESGRGAPVASLISTAGWATGATKRYGRAWIVTPDGIIDPAEARRLAAADERRHRPRNVGPATTAPRPSFTDRVKAVTPDPLKTLLKDGRQVLRARHFHIDDGPWDDDVVDWVWQRHELFQTAGLDLADRLGVPSVLFVPATKVWESTRWGTRRPGWGGMVERFGESPQLRRATVVACGSEAVADQVRRLGTPDERILVTPTGVNVDRFADGDRETGRRRAGIAPDDDRMVVGWMGSFRPFHDLDLLVDAVRDLSGIRLLLVGDGPQRPEIEARCAALGVDATFTGTVSQGTLPDVLSAMDVAVVVSGSADAFHYSPLKLGEYLATGLAVIAPDVASIRNRVEDGVDALLVPAADREALREALLTLRDDPARRTEMAAAAGRLAQRSFTWVEQVRRIDHVLGVTAAEANAGRVDGHHADVTTIVPPSRD